MAILKLNIYRKKGLIYTYIMKNKLLKKILLFFSQLLIGLNIAFDDDTKLPEIFIGE